MGCTNSKEKEEPTIVGNNATDTNSAPDDTHEPANPIQVAEKGDDGSYEQALDSKYKMNGPSFQGEVFPCFKTGQLYRIINGNQWAFYNDTQLFEMHISVTFASGSCVDPMGNTSKTSSPDGEFLLEVTVYPGDTEMFMDGKYTAFKSSFSGKSLSPAYAQTKYDESEARVKEDLARINHFTNSSDTGDVLDICLRNSVTYVDRDFLPGQSSVVRDGVDKRRMKLACWQRPTQFLPERLHPHIVMFRNIEPNDIDQGQLGDCWLLCAIAAVAEFPERVERLFRHPISDDEHRKEEKVGAFRITLNVNGWWTSFVVDSYLPTIGNIPCFAKNVEDPAEMWASVIEKAFAKACGSYAALASGDALHALQDLTGFPCSRFDTEWADALKDQGKSDELFEQMVGYDENQFVIIVNTPGMDNSSYAGGSNSKSMEDKYKRAGLGMGHAYSVISVFNFPEDGVQLLKIRNPWGNGTEWTGDWSDDSSKWSAYPHISEKCKNAKAADGTFWMEFKDVKAYFDGGGVCLAMRGWHDYRVKGNLTGAAATVALEIHVTERTEMFLTLSQTDKRQMMHLPSYKYEGIMLSVSRQAEARQHVHLNSTLDADKPGEKFTFNYARDLGMRYVFEPSDSPYLVLPRVYAQNPTGSVPYTLGAISKQPVGEGFTANFVQLPANCKVWDNYPKFAYDSVSATPIEAEFQYGSENAGPVIKRGTSLQF